MLEKLPLAICRSRNQVLQLPRDGKFRKGPQGPFLLIILPIDLA